MSTSDMNDIEDIFRKAAADYPADFSAKHWQALKTKLDARATHAAAVRSKQYKKVALVLVLLIMLSGGTYWIISSNNNTGESSHMRTIENTTVPNENQLKKEDSEGSLEVKEKQPSQNVVVASDQPLRPEEKSSVAPKRETAPAKALDREKKNPSADQASTSSTAIKSNRHAAPSEVIISQTEEAASKDIDQKNFQTADKMGMLAEESPELRKEQGIIKASKAKAPETTPDVLDEQQHFPDKPVAKETRDEEKGGAEQVENMTGNETEMLADTAKHSSDADRPSSEAGSAAPIEKQPEFTERPLFGVSFTVGPDLSVLGLGEITRPGYSYGLMMHYNLSKRWSVGIGALKTTKRYIGAGYDYNPPKGYWEYATNNVIPEKVTGECALIEVPLDIRYDFLRSGKHNFHASAGVSSYFMRHESYKYTFEEPNPCGSQGWKSDKAEGRHLFNIVNFSIGYERDIGRKFSLGLAPYVKVPVKGIGWSQVRFVSIGTNFSLKYNFLTRRSAGL